MLKEEDCFIIISLDFSNIFLQIWNILTCALNEVLTWTECVLLFVNPYFPSLWVAAQWPGLIGWLSPHASFWLVNNSASEMSEKLSRHFTEVSNLQDNQDKITHLIMLNVLFCLLVTIQLWQYDKMFCYLMEIKTLKMNFNKPKRLTVAVAMMTQTFRRPYMSWQSVCPHEYVRGCL